MKRIHRPFFKSLTTVLIATLVLGAGFNAYAVDIASAEGSFSNRPSPAYTQRRVWTESDIRVRVEAISKASVPRDLRDKLIEDLIDLLYVRGHDDITFHRWMFHGDVNGQVYINYALNLIEAIEFSHEPVLASIDPADAFFYSKRTFVISYHYLALPQVERWSILMHEARHLEEPTSFHIACREHETSRDDLLVIDHQVPLENKSPSDSLRDEFACDATASGAYGASVAFLEAIAFSCDNCSSSARHKALRLGLDYAQRIAPVRERNRIKRAVFPPEYLR